MFPRVIYELLPYLYLGIGFSTGLIFNSSIIFIAASLLIATGISILYMRYSYRRRLTEMLPAEEVKATVKRNYVSRRKDDRRQRLTSQFPLIDCYGNLVTNERRSGDRRMMPG